MPPVFISRSSKDRQVALTICAALENRRLGCWIASRDVSPGENYQEAIVRAIRAAKVMVLVFSDNANNSDEIKKELSLASRYNLVVIPARVEDVVPSEAFELEFATRQWINLFEDWEHEIERLSRHIGGAVGVVPTAQSAGTPSTGPSIPPTAREPASSHPDVKSSEPQAEPRPTVTPSVELQKVGPLPHAGAARPEPSRVAPHEIPIQKADPPATARTAAKCPLEPIAQIDAGPDASPVRRPSLNILDMLAIVVGVALAVQSVFQVIVARGDYLVWAYDDITYGKYLESSFQVSDRVLFATVLLCALSLALAVGTLAIGAGWRPTQPWGRQAALAVCMIVLIADFAVAVVGWKYGSPWGGLRDLRFTVFALPGVLLSGAVFFFWSRVRSSSAP